VNQRSVPYPGPGLPLHIPEPVWIATLEVMRSYSRRSGSKRRRGSEALIYLGGHVAGEAMWVTSLYRLDHEPQGDRVVVGEGQAHWLLRELRARDEKLIGQVHSHRGAAGHSAGDDQHATSFHSGFVSIVVPSFGVSVTSITECAVLEFRAPHFGELTRAEVAQRIHVTPYTAARVPSPSVPESKGSRWQQSVQRLRSTVRRRRSPDTA